MIGVENGLFISYKGVVVRTSHITGSLTDMGVYIGHCIKKEKLKISGKYFSVYLLFYLLWQEVFWNRSLLCI